MIRGAIAKVVTILNCVLLAVSLSACTASAHFGFGHGPADLSAGIGISHSPGHHKGGPPEHAPAHGYRAKHKYHYYPDTHVYFDISRELYFYLEGDAWRVSASLPSSLHVQLGGHVTLELDSDKPYEHFKEHKKKYPPGQMKKKKK